MEGLKVMSTSFPIFPSRVSLAGALEADDKIHSSIICKASEF